MTPSPIPRTVEREPRIPRFAATITDCAAWTIIESERQARLNVIHCILSRFKCDCKDLIPESLEPRTDSDKLAGLLVDGVLLDDVNAKSCGNSGTDADT